MSTKRLVASVPEMVRRRYSRPNRRRFSPWWDQHTAERLVSDADMDKVWATIVQESGDDPSIAVRFFEVACTLRGEWKDMPRATVAEARKTVAGIAALASRLAAEIDANADSILLARGELRLRSLIEKAFRSRRPSSRIMADERALVSALTIGHPTGRGNDSLPTISEILRCLARAFDTKNMKSRDMRLVTKPNAQGAFRTFALKHLHSHLGMQNVKLPMQQLVTIVNVICNLPGHELDASLANKLLKSS